MESENLFHPLRSQRLRESCGAVQVVNRGLSPEFLRRSWIAVTCSRLGHDARLHGEVCRFLARSMLDCRSRGGVLLVADGSAAAPWTLRAAELFGVDVIRLAVDKKTAEKATPRIICHDGQRAISRDAAVIAIADRVDAAYVRPAGTIAECLCQRLAKYRDASVRVAVISTRKSAAKDLIHQGAIGWFYRATPLPNPADDIGEDLSHPANSLDPAWTRSDGQWLVHCTRACVGPWPGQTMHQYQDSLLLQPQDHQRLPLDTLTRILRSGRLVASAIATAKAWPVVCFSEAPLCQLLAERCYRPHLQRWDYEPYGIAIRKSAVADLGIKPVIYGEPQRRHQFDSRDQFRFQATGNTYDWRREREWRAPHDIDLNALPADDIRIFVSSGSEAALLAEKLDRQVDVVTASSNLPSPA